MASQTVVQVTKTTNDDPKLNTAEVTVAGLPYRFKGKGAHGNADKQVGMVLKAITDCEEFTVTVDNPNGQPTNDLQPYAGGGEGG